MTTITQCATTAVLAGSALMGLHGPAAASATIEQASICQPYFNDPVANLRRTVNSIKNIAAEPKAVICPVVRSQDPTAFGMWTYVTGNLANSGKVTCTVWSATGKGVLIGGTASSFTGTGDFELGLPLQQAMVPSLSAQSVVCTLPPGGSLFGITQIL